MVTFDGYVVCKGLLWRRFVVMVCCGDSSFSDGLLRLIITLWKWLRCGEGSLR